MAKRRKLLAITAAVGLTLAFSGCAGSALGGDDEAPSGEAESIKVGLMLPLSGVYAPLGEEMLAGFELYLEQNDGQLAGHDVELVVEDDEANAQTGLLVANKLIQEDQVDFAVGIVSSAVAGAVAPLFETAQIPLLVAVSTFNALTGDQKSDFVYRVGLSSYQAQYAGGQWMHEGLGADTLFLMAADYAGGHESANDLRAGFEAAGGTVVGEAYPPFGTTQDYQPFLSQAKSSGAEAIYGFFGGGEAVSVVKQYDEFGLKADIPLVGGASLTSGDVLSAQGASAEGVYTVMSYVPTLENEANEAFVAAFEEKTGNVPSYFALYPYDAAQVIAAALEKVGSTSDRVALAKAMEGVEIVSPRGPLTIDPDTHGTIQSMYIVQIQDVDGVLTPVVVADLGLLGEQPE
ncbi:MAG: Branched-chain amino acid transport system substrate-binding protein [Rhodoglobus sp.]|nr:Branched-chain amino acid transport system substrate-binding protein [Rhodoglobus sp.]